MIKKRKVCKFNSAGIHKFNQLISNNYNFKQSIHEIDELCDSEGYIEVISEKEIGNDYKVRSEVASDIIEIKDNIKGFNLDNDGLWCWLSAHMRPSLAPERFLKWNHYIPSKVRSEGRRHTIKTAYSLYSRYGKKVVNFIDNTPLYIHGDVLESFTQMSNLTLFEDDLGIDILNKIYIDSDTDKIKTGAAGGGTTERPGQFRRMNKILKQFNLTYNLRQMRVGDLMDLLPEEFDRFINDDAKKNCKKAMTSVNAIILAYYLSKFDEKAYSYFNLKNKNQVHNLIAEKFNDKASTIKNIRDAYDSLHNNPRAGWKHEKYQRELTNRWKMIMEPFKDSSFEDMSHIVTRILDKPDEIIFDESI